DRHLTLGRGDRWLIDEAEQSLLFAAVAVALPDAADVRDEVEGESSIGRQGNRQRVLHIEEVRQEEVPVVVEGQAGIAAGVAEVVVVPDQLRGPGLPAV